jgi:NitT/TauT family transport system ATP-binding protein/nitrate/nitrite transport system substrate-binding protein
LAALLSKPEWVGVAPPLIAASLPGGDGRAVDRSVFAAHQAGRPNPDHARWFVRQMARWRIMPDDAEAISVALYRPDIYEQAALALVPPARPSDATATPPPAATPT